MIGMNHKHIMKIGSEGIYAESTTSYIMRCIICDTFKVLHMPGGQKRPGNPSVWMMSLGRND